MSLNLSQLNQQVGQMGQTLSERALQWQERVELAGRRLVAYSDRHAWLLGQIERTRSRDGEPGLHWTGAYPAYAGPRAEPLAQGVDLPAGPAAATLIANDGSQILPDRHALLPYFLINVGTIVLRHGSGAPPRCEISQELHYDEDELYDKEGQLIAAGHVHARRDLFAVQELARLAAAEPGRPLLAIGDGPLLLWSYQELLPGAERRVEQRVRQYLGALDELRAAGAWPAGYIDRSDYRGVVKLLHLATLETISAEALAGFDLSGVHDVDVFALVLRPGQRSALFVTQSRVNKTYRGEGHEIWFFYLNVAPPPANGAPANGAPANGAPANGRSGGPAAIARIELPAWVAEDRAALDAVHALLYRQCQVVADHAYPYVLTRADELARIDPGDRREVERVLQRMLLQQHLRGERSQKAQTKQLTGARRTRRRRR
jgi:hypothetical protein